MNIERFERMRTVGDIPAILDAADDVVSVLGQMVGFFNFAAFSCSEIEKLADLCRACGDTATAESIIAEHARDDDEGDAHYLGEQHDEEES